MSLRGCSIFFVMGSYSARFYLQAKCAWCILPGLCWWYSHFSKRQVLGKLTFVRLVEKWCNFHSIPINLKNVDRLCYFYQKRYNDYVVYLLFSKQRRVDCKVKYFGIILDSCLTRRPQVENKMQTATSAFLACRLLLEELEVILRHALALQLCR